MLSRVLRPGPAWPTFRPQARDGSGAEVHPVLAERHAGRGVSDRATVVHFSQGSAEDAFSLYTECLGHFLTQSSGQPLPCCSFCCLLIYQPGYSARRQPRIFRGGWTCVNDAAARSAAIGLFFRTVIARRPPKYPSFRVGWASRLCCKRPRPPR